MSMLELWPTSGLEEIQTVTFTLKETESLG